MKISLVASLLFHVCVFLGAQKAFPVNQFTEPLRTYHVDIFRPPLEPGDKQAESPEPADLSLTQKPYHAETEDTISLDTKDERYRPYAMTIKERLMRHWEYPQEAREKLIEGQVLMRFSLNKKGHLEDIQILRACAYDILDAEAEKAIRMASPFPPFPSSISVARLNITANFAYKLTARYRPNNQISSNIWHTQNGP